MILKKLLFSDEHFFENDAIPPTTVIRPSVKTKNRKAEEFLRENIESSRIKHGRDTVDGPKKRASMAVFGNQLKQQGQNWRDWKFSVQIKVTMVKKIEEKLEKLDVEKGKEKSLKCDVPKIEEKAVKIDAEINLIQADLL